MRGGSRRCYVSLRAVAGAGSAALDRSCLYQVRSAPFGQPSGQPKGAPYEEGADFASRWGLRGEVWACLSFVSDCTRSLIGS